MVLVYKNLQETWKKTQTDPLDDLDIKRLMDDYRTKLKDIPQKYSSLYDGTLGDVAATEHVIDLTEGAKPVRQLPYRSGPGSRILVK